MSRLPGVSGSLFPSRYLADAWPHERLRSLPPLQQMRQHLRRWWARVEMTCGPATGLRALFDLVAMPLFGVLGFRAKDVAFDRHQARGWLSTPRGTPVGLVVLPWAERPSAVWRDVAGVARHVGAAWAFLVAPPFVALIDARGHAMRRDVEFTLPEALDDESFSRLWWLARAAAFDPVAPAGPSAIDALIERAADYQDRVRDDLQHGVAEALAHLSQAIATAPGGPRRRPPAGAVHHGSSPTSFDEALTIVYRILFLLFAESRELLPVRAPVFAGAYAVTALAREAPREAAGLWEALAATTRLSRLGCRTGDLLVRPFNGRLFARRAAPSLERPVRVGRRPARGCVLDVAAQRALVALGSRHGPGGREEIAYADLGVEQLGSVYERILDLDLPSPPGHAAPQRTTLTRRAVHSVRRKETGTFYTPRSLAEFLVRRTLAPLVAGASSDAIGRLRVVDPAMGSGAFLVAACRFLAGAYERALIDEGRLTPADLDDQQRADIRRLVAERCLAGVDRNPVAVQLARLSLWLATLAQGKPLTFLDHRLRVGNSLVGASPADLLRSPGRRPAAPAVLPLFEGEKLEDSLRRAALPLQAIADRRDDSVADVRAKEALWRQLVSEDSPLSPWRRASDLWCARAFWPAGSTPPGPAEWRATIDALFRADRSLPRAHLEARLTEADEIGRRRAFFHWALEFADVFYDRAGQPLARAGFDAVIGNPPWEMLRGGETRDDDEALERRGLFSFVRDSGVYSACTRGHLNLYQPFVERALAICRGGGRIGLVLPWGLASDDGARELRQRLFDTAGVDTIVGLDNAGALFPIHRGLRFLVLTATNASATREVRARFGVKTAAELDDLPGRVESPEADAYPVRLSPGLLRKVSGPALRVPDVRRPEDLALLERLTAKLPPLGDASGWQVTFGRELNATEDRTHFGTEGLPVLEGKHLSPFHVDLTGAVVRMDRAQALRRLPDRRFTRPRLGYRDVSGVSNRLSLIAAVVPAEALTTHTIFCLRSALPAGAQHLLCALLNSYVLNTIARLLMGGHLTTSLVEGLPAPIRGTDPRRERRLTALAARLARGSTSVHLAARLQADVARLYELDADEFARVLDGFPLVPAAERALAAQMFQLS